MPACSTPTSHFDSPMLFSDMYLVHSYSRRRLKLFIRKGWESYHRACQQSGLEAQHKGRSVSVPASACQEWWGCCCSHRDAAWLVLRTWVEKKGKNYRNVALPKLINKVLSNYPYILNDNIIHKYVWHYGLWNALCLCLVLPLSKLEVSLYKWNYITDILLVILM